MAVTFGITGHLLNMVSIIKKYHASMYGFTDYITNGLLNSLNPKHQFIWIVDTEMVTPTSMDVNKT